MGHVLERSSRLVRYEPDGTVTTMGAWNYYGIVPRDSPGSSKKGPPWRPCGAPVRRHA